MKNFSFKLTTLLLIVVLLSSCAAFNPNVSSSNVNHTQVNLSQANFKVVNRVEGSSSATYILGIGGLAKKGLVASARKEMYQDANLKGSQIIINEHTEWKVSNIIPYVWGRIVVTTSGHVIEFTK
jgi:hypothetical protein